MKDLKEYSAYKMRMKVDNIWERAQMDFEEKNQEMIAKLLQRIEDRAKNGEYYLQTDVTFFKCNMSEEDRWIEDNYDLLKNTLNSLGYYMNELWGKITISWRCVNKDVE